MAQSRPGACSDLGFRELALYGYLMVAGYERIQTGWPGLTQITHSVLHAEIISRNVGIAE